MRRLAVVRLAIVAALLAPAATALARSEKTLAYVRADAWPTAVRFIRVDEHLKIVEKDADAGYVLFELHEENHTFRGSLEVMTVNKDNRTQVRFVIQLEDRPSYLEQEMLERLERKLHAELGSPAPAPTKKDPPPDSEKDKDKDHDGPSGGNKDKEPSKDPPSGGGLRDLPRETLSPTP